ncbi:MAG: hypothetical protein J5927_06465 [Oscillospiraceae bacterium]|nr:hypothetical protein [Oscillospiraceae bacterium]
MTHFKFFLALLSNAMLMALAVLVVLDMRNPYLDYLSSLDARVFLLILCALGILVGCLFLASLRRRQRRELVRDRDEADG